ETRDAKRKTYFAVYVKDSILFIGNMNQWHSRLFPKRKPRTTDNELGGVFSGKKCHKTPGAGSVLRCRAAPEENCTIIVRAGCSSPPHLSARACRPSSLRGPPL